MEARFVCLAVFLCTVAQGASGLQWTSSVFLPNGTSLKACVGDTLTFNWTFALDPEEQVDTVRWHYFPEGQSDAVEAILASGSFLPLPGSQHSGRLQYLPNAGIQLSGATTQDSGTYWVQVNFAKHGARYTEIQAVDARISGPDTCRTSEDMLKICLDQEQDLTSRLAAATTSVRLQEAQIQNLRGQLDSCLRNGEPVTTTEPPPTYPSWFHPANCRDLKVYDPSSGVYTVFLNASTPVDVYCDQTTSGGEWLVIQRRMDGTVDFYRNWSEYEQGFGDLRGEFWLGLKYISAITKSQAYTLRVEVQDFSGNSHSVQYTSFVVDGPQNSYQLSVGGHGGDVLSYSNGQRFSTYDRDHDHATNNCAEKTQGAWWWRDCSSYSRIANPNGRYKLADGTGYDKITWYSANLYDHPLKRIEMKIRPST